MIEELRTLIGGLPQLVARLEELAKRTAVAVF